MRICLSLLLLLPLCASGCAVIAGTAVGVVIAQEAMDNSTYVVQLQTPSDVTWEEVKVSLSKQAAGPLDVDEALKVAIGRVEGSKVTVSVESFDQRSSRMVVEASHYGMTDGEMADQVAKQIIKDLQAVSDQQ